MTADRFHRAEDAIVVRVDADLEELIPSFIANRRIDIQTIGNALDLDDFLTLRRVGHNLRGAGAAFGFDRVSAIGAQLEEAALASNPQGVRVAAEELAAYMLRALIVYEAPGETRVSPNVD